MADQQPEELGAEMETALRLPPDDDDHHHSSIPVLCKSWRRIFSRRTFRRRRRSSPEPSCPQSPPHSSQVTEMAEADPWLPEELGEQILLRLPPDDPATLLRASLVCQQWHRIATSPGFRRCFAERHGAPPLLGFFLNTGTKCTFVPTTAAAFSLPVPVGLSFLDCRHGRALLFSGHFVFPDFLVVWEPITGHQRRVPLPATLQRVPKAAVVCAAAGCNHRDGGCHGKPFRIVLLKPYHENLLVWEYSSETGAWGDPIQAIFHPVVGVQGSVLVGNSLYFLVGNREIIEYDLGEKGMAVIDLPDASGGGGGAITLFDAEDGGLGVARVKNSCLHLWCWETTCGWVMWRSIDLEDLLPAYTTSLGEEGAHLICHSLELEEAARVICFAEGADVVFLEEHDGIFAIELKSGRARKVGSGMGTSILFPFVSFYTPRTIYSSLMVVYCEEGDHIVSPKPSSVYCSTSSNYSVFWENVLNKLGLCRVCLKPAFVGLQIDAEEQ